MIVYYGTKLYKKNQLLDLIWEKGNSDPVCMKIHHAHHAYIIVLTPAKKCQ